MEQFKDAVDRQGATAEEQRDPTASPTTLLELVLRRLAEISERSAAKDSGKLDVPTKDIGADTRGAAK